VTTYKETRNGLIGEAYSTKLSPWLSCGALSAREVWWAVRRYERERTENDSTYWVRFELLWREFFQWYALRWGPHLFQAQGVKGAERGLTPQRLTHNPLSRREQDLLKRWREGRTGEPFVDANMRELIATGWMSNRGRQNVASYLIHDLKLDWRAGAGAFEGMLIDDDPASNWGNWAYIAGVGSDPRPLRAFNVKGQAKRYDPEGAYRALWG
jgi:deoxyribodipyrimidine photo-lyase